VRSEAVCALQGTVLIHNAEELQTYSKTEEDRLEGIVKGIADAGIQVVAAGSAFGEMALHFIEKYKMMAVRIPSKFELRRFCRCTPPHRAEPSQNPDSPSSCKDACATGSGHQALALPHLP
jgi:chaperonin GroEL (HSP60 family)